MKALRREPDDIKVVIQGAARDRSMGAGPPQLRKSEISQHRLVCT